MKVIGIVGGVASGKSLVAEQFARLGAAVLDADKFAHEVLTEDRVKDRIRARWGTAVFDENGDVSRPKLAEIVFAPPPAGPAELKQLEAIVHPRIADRLRRCIDDLAREKDREVAVLDAAVMFEAGWDKYCDKILFVETPYAQRKARAGQRGWGEEKWKAREEAQDSLDKKRNRADTIIDNSGSVERTFRQVERIWKELVLCQR